MNKTVLSLADRPLLDWRGRWAVLSAESEREQMRLYIADLLWLMVKVKYPDVRQPSTILKEAAAKKAGPQTAAEIKEYLLEKIRGTRAKLMEEGGAS